MFRLSDGSLPERNQSQRGDIDIMSMDLLALLENPETIEPLSLRVKKNQVERRTPVALKAPYPYVNDLLALESHRREVVVHNQLQKIVTPLKWWVWKAALTSHPDGELREYITWGIQEGFRVGFNGRISHKLVAANMPLATRHPQPVEQFLQEECEAQRVIGPFSGVATPGPIRAQALVNF